MGGVVLNDICVDDFLMINIIFDGEERGYFIIGRSVNVFV